MAEVAGLVLGAIPLLISALEHSDDITGPFRRLLHWRRYRNDQIRQLNYCSVSYDQTLRLLLKNVVDDEELSEMLEDPQCSTWGRPGLERDLRAKLGMVYESCLSTIKEMDSVMREIAGNIEKLGGSGQVQTAGLRAVLNANTSAQRISDRNECFQFATGLRYTISNRQIKKSLKKLQECNARLDNFISKAGMIQDNFNSPSFKISFVMPLDDIRCDATRIYDSITRSWCAFHNTHTAAWRLESRIRRRKKAGSGCPKQGPKVMFVESAPEELPLEGPQALTQVTNICSALNKNIAESIEFRLDGEGSLRYHNRDSAEQSPSISERGETLDELLSKHQFYFGTSMESYTLAINLITTLVQLGGTPWLRNPWTKKDIMFFAIQGSNLGNLDTLHPYLINQHPPDDSPRNGLHPSNHSSNEVDRNNIATLGVMLLEMQSGRRIEDFRTPEDGAFSTGSNLAVATRLLQRLHDRGSMSEGLTRAITYCLQSSINPAASLTDKQFVDAFINETVSPLEKERRFLMDH
ncbi:hypothetical protein PG997_000099 [Apiospora hydei]|uniref:DUF7580 domain-containing protein n=1 Tax=Apiospora hydei TaxID=1337664 RepID=A0ABR1X9S2_9PEZI